MQKSIRLFLILGIVLNILGVLFLAAFLLKFNASWNVSGLPVEAKWQLADKLLRINIYQAFPLCILTMGFSAVMFWIVRKQ